MVVYLQRDSWQTCRLDIGIVAQDQKRGIRGLWNWEGQVHVG